MSTCLITEVKRQCAMLVLMGDRLSALLVSLMALQLMLVDRNPFRPCLLHFLEGVGPWNQPIGNNGVTLFCCQI